MIFPAYLMDNSGMVKKLIALLTLSLLVNSIAIASSWAFSSELATEPLASHHQMTMDEATEDHCETEQLDFSCWSHCTMAQIALPKFDFPLPLSLSLETNAPRLIGQSTRLTSSHWRPPIYLS